MFLKMHHHLLTPAGQLISLGDTEQQEVKMGDGR